MKLLGYCNLFVRKVNKGGKSFTFPELSISSKDESGVFKNVTLKANFAKDIVDINELEENSCYNIEVLDSIVNIKYDDFKKCNVLQVCITDFEFKKTTKFTDKKKPTTKKKSPK